MKGGNPRGEIALTGNWSSFNAPLWTYIKCIFALKLMIFSLPLMYRAPRRWNVQLFDSVLFPSGDTTRTLSSYQMNILVHSCITKTSEILNSLFLFVFKECMLDHLEPWLSKQSVNLTCFEINFVKILMYMVRIKTFSY